MHPLKVYYTYGGEHYLVQWWSHAEQNRIVIARHQSSLDVVINEIIESTDCEIISGYHIDIVAPSNLLTTNATKELRDRKVSYFLDTVIDMINHHTVDVSTHFVKCDTWSPRSKHSYKDDHFDCANCINGIRLVSLTPEELYDRYSSVWVNNFGTFYQESNDGCFSRAEEASDNDELYAVYNDFGHHRQGINIAKCTEYPNNTDSTFLFQDD